MTFLKCEEESIERTLLHIHNVAPRVISNTVTNDQQTAVAKYLLHLRRHHIITDVNDTCRILLVTTQLGNTSRNLFHLKIAAIDKVGSDGIL